MLRITSALVVCLIAAACSPDSPEPEAQWDTGASDAASDVDGLELPTPADGSVQPDGVAPVVEVLAIRPSDLAGLPVVPEEPDVITPAWDSAFLATHSNGFGLQPHITVTLSGDGLDVSSFSSQHVFLQGPGASVVGIEHRVYDPTTRTLSFVPERYLHEAATYTVVVDGLTAGGQPIAPTSEAFTTGHFTTALASMPAWLDTLPITVVIDAEWASDSPEIMEWDAHRGTLAAGQLIQLPWSAWEAGTPDLVLSSVFATAGDQVVELPLGASGRHEAPALEPGLGPVQIFQRFESLPLPNVSLVRFGSFEAPWQLSAERLFQPPDEPPDMRKVGFSLFLPAGDAPPSGWPVVLYGNGYRSHRHHAAAMASQLAQQGFATLAVTAVGHGGGPDGHLRLGDLTWSDLGRGLDVDSDGIVRLEEGMRADPLGPSHGGIRGLTDGVRQTVVDYMTALRVIASGQLADISTAPEDRFYFGVSNGGRVGALLVSVDPALQVAVLNVPPSEAWGPIQDTWRAEWATAFNFTVPPLRNPANEWGFFREDIPARGEPVQVGLADGAAHIQQYIDRYRWASLPMNTAAYAPGLVGSGKQVLVQIGRGDPVVTNPGSIDLVREGALHNSTCVVWPARSLWPAHLGEQQLSLVHLFAFMPYQGPAWHPGVIGQGARDQITTWYQTAGDVLLDPDPQGDLFGQGDVFEAPISPESLELLHGTVGYGPDELGP